MKSLAIPTLALLALVAACGSSHDPDPEKVKESLVVLAGSGLEGEARSDNSYPFLDWYRYEEDVDDLPECFDYDTFDLFFDSWDRLWVEYDLTVAPWVAPGEYRFSVTYDFYDADAIFREEIRFRFVVDVVDQDRHGPVRLQVEQSVEPEDREAGADVEIEIGDGE